MTTEKKRNIFLRESMSKQNKISPKEQTIFFFIGQLPDRKFFLTEADIKIFPQPKWNTDFQAGFYKIVLFRLKINRVSGEKLNRSAYNLYNVDNDPHFQKT